jgi:hypothetical protein
MSACSDHPLAGLEPTGAIAPGKPPPPAFALEGSAIARVGPGKVVKTLEHAGYVLQVLGSAHRAAAPDSFALRITKNGRPIRAPR